MTERSKSAPSSQSSRTSQSAPKVGVVLDENTSGDATRYEAPKSLFRALADAGAYTLAVPYDQAHVKRLIADFDALVCPGGRFAFPQEWYGGRRSKAPLSERLSFELALMEGFLESGKPVLGICSGMQMLAGLSGAKLCGDLAASNNKALPHNGHEVFHPVTIVPETKLASITGGGTWGQTWSVNSLHNEAVLEVAPGLSASAHAPDGTIEAVELDSPAFALGVQWHQERYQGQDHAGNALFRALVEAV